MKSSTPRTLPAKPNLLLAAAKRGHADAVARFPHASPTLALNPRFRPKFSPPH